MKSVPFLNKKARHFVLILVISVLLAFIAYAPALSPPQPASAHSDEVRIMPETISSGYAHSCAIRSNGTATCWGRNDFGQSTPPAGTFTQVSTNGYHNCAIKGDGSLAYWGNNANGQVTPPAGTFSQVSAGFYHTCANYN